eukprot:350258-Chlamydomonas_euryale.AAC.2
MPPERGPLQSGWWLSNAGGSWQSSAVVGHCHQQLASANGGWTWSAVRGNAELNGHGLTASAASKATRSSPDEV